MIFKALILLYFRVLTTTHHINCLMTGFICELSAGYWTDNGAYYYYKTVDGMNYEDTLIHLQQKTQEMEIPMKYVEVTNAGQMNVS